LLAGFLLCVFAQQFKPDRYEAKHKIDSGNFIGIVVPSIM
jgi:hypothetical protein